MSIGEIHDIVEPLLADRCEILGRFKLWFIDNKIQQNFVLVFGEKFVLINGVDCILKSITYGVNFL